jgi:Zn-dependent protease
MAQHAWQPWSGDGDDRSGTGGAGPADRRPSRSIPLGRIAGIPIRMHWSFLLLLGFVAFVEWPGGLAAEAAGAIWIAALFAFVVVHELAHCLVARRRGGSVIDILLLPIGGMSRMDHIPAAPADEAAVAAAGPATSLALGALLLAIGAAAGSSLWPPTLIAGSWWARLGWLNLLLGAFNLLPALPMDGGRVLRAALTHGRTRARATRIAASVAHVVAAGLVLAGVFWDFWLVFIGVFVWLGASGEVAQVEQSEREDRGRRQRTGGPRPPGQGSQWSWVPPPGSPPPAWRPPTPPAWPPPTWRPPTPPAWPPPTWPPPTSAQGPPAGTGSLSPDPGAHPNASRRADESPVLPVDVAVERRGGDTRGGQPTGEHVG